MSPEKKFLYISFTLLSFAFLWTFNSLFIAGNFHLLWWLLFEVFFLGVIESAYLHKYLSHKSWACPRWLEYICLTFATGFHYLPAMFYAGGHRKHHFHWDNDKPDIQGQTTSFYNDLKVTCGGIVIEERWMRDMFTDSLLINQAIYYWQVMFGFGVLWSLLFGIDSYLFILTTVKSLQFIHNRYVLHDKTNQPRNSVLMTFMISPEFHHKNHHKNPADPKIHAYDIIGYCLIKMFPRQKPNKNLTESQ
tara:strand:+ start:2656 stop:3399 length:744 start_codon:yes stop_codon:yes gene_type:complete